MSDATNDKKKTNIEEVEKKGVKNTLYSNFWTTESIAREIYKKREDEKRKEGKSVEEKSEEEFEKEIERQADDISRTFRIKLSEKLNFTPELIELFMSETESGTGRFIFEGENVPDIMDELQTWLKEYDDVFSWKEKEKIAGQLMNILPLCRNMKEIRRHRKWKKKDEVQKLNKNKVKEINLGEFAEEDLYYDIYSECERNADEKSQMADGEFAISLYNRYKENGERIKEVVEDYYFRNIKEENYERDFFVRLDAKKITSNKLKIDFYSYQYSMVKGWESKWKFVMEEIMRLRTAERFNIGEEVCISKNLSLNDRREFYKTGKTNDSDLLKLCRETTWLRISDLCECILKLYKSKESDTHFFEKRIANVAEREMRKECCNECRELFYKCIKQKEKFSDSDYTYILQCMLKELMDIKDIILNEQKEIYYANEVGNVKRGDLAHFYKIKEKIENTSRDMFYYRPDIKG